MPSTNDTTGSEPDRIDDDRSPSRQNAELPASLNGHVDPEAMFEEALLAVQPQLYAYVLTHVPDPVAVRDLVQEINLFALRKQHTLSASADFWLWLTKRANQVLARERRRVESRSRLFASSLVEHFALEGEDRFSRSMTPEYEALMHCIGRLSDDHRTVIDLRYRRGVRLRNIADRLDCSVQSVKELLVRIRERLRECVEARVAQRSKS